MNHRLEPADGDRGAPLCYLVVDTGNTVDAPF